MIAFYILIEDNKNTQPQLIAPVLFDKKNITEFMGINI